MASAESNVVVSVMGNLVSTVSNSPLGSSLAVDVGIQWGMWIVSSLLKTERFFDLTGSATFLLLVYRSLQHGQTFFPRQTTQAGMIMLWAFRLGMYLFVRVMKEGHDRRFTKAKNNPGIFWIYWTLQAVWIFLTLLPSLILLSKTKDKPLCTRDYIGWGLWATGFLCEVVADYQKSVFRNNPDNAGKFITSGLWSISRHPNYFGEILSWFGLYITASSTFSGMEYLSVLSPMFVFYLITYISGVPLLEKSGLKRWGNNPAYQHYLKTTPKLIPFLW